MKKLALVCAGCAILASACGMKPQDNYMKMRANLVQRNFQAVDQYLEKNKKKIYSKDNRLLFYMDKGTVLHLGKNYKESNAVLEKAKQTAQDLWTESIGSNAASWLTTDNSLPYQGQDFEKVAIHFIAALNYLGLGDPGGARVEARQISNKLELYTSKYENRDNIYRDDAFGRWLAGKLAETDLRDDPNALNVAWIDYKKAIKVYETDYAERYQLAPPRFVIADALRALEALGVDFQSEYNQVRSRFPAVEYDSRAATEGMGEVVFIHLTGEAPFKVDRYWDAMAGSDPFRVAYPEFVPKKNQIMGCRIHVAGKVANAELGQPLTKIAIQNLAVHMGRIKAKAIARSVAKYIASRAAQEAGKQTGGTAGALLQLGGAIFQAANYIAEEADKRSWITLPSAINVARTFVAPGQHQIEVDLLAPGGRVVDRVSMPVQVTAGEITFVSYRTFR